MSHEPKFDADRTSDTISEALHASETKPKRALAPTQAASLLTENGYTSVISTNPSNAFIYAENSPTRVTHDEIAGIDTLHANFGVTIEGHLPNGLSAQTQKIFTVLLQAVTRQLPRSKEPTDSQIEAARHLEFTLDEYRQLCGLRDLKTAREQLEAAILDLTGITLAWQDYVWARPADKPNGRRTKTLTTHYVPIAGQGDIPAEDGKKPVKNNVCSFSFSTDFVKYLCSTDYIMPLPQNVFLVNTRVNPNSLAFIWALANNTNQNYRNLERRNTISVKVMLDRAPRLQRYKDLQKRGRINELIFQPFNRDLHALIDKYHVLTSYEYITKDGQRIGEEQLGGLTYAVFASLMIRYELKNYPDSYARRRLIKEDERAARRKRNTASKKARAEADKQTSDADKEEALTMESPPL